MPLTQVDQGLLGQFAQYTGFKNRIINGAMVIDQRTAGSSSTPSSGGYVSVDRWAYYGSQASKITIGQNLDSVTPPAGFRNYLGLKVAATATVGASDYFLVGQTIEGFNLADLNFGLATAAAFTLSFWVRSSVTGTFGAYLKNGSSNRSYPFTYTISAANTWEQKSITVTADTTGTWNTTNGAGLLLYFTLGSGSSVSFTPNAWGANDALGATGGTSIMGTLNNTFYITGVQLEKGSTATSFDYRPYGTELALCQRYYLKLNASAQYTAFAEGISTTTSTASLYTKFTTSMRSAPTVSFNDLLISDSAVYVLAVTAGTMSILAGTDCARVSVGNTSGATQYRPAQLLANSTSSYLDFSAEL